MIRVLRDHLALVFAGTFLGLFFIFNGGEKFMLPRLVMVGWLVLAVLAWKPLHKRFRAWAILFSYFLSSIPLLLFTDPSASLSAFLQLLFSALACSAVFLLFNRQKPVEQRRPTVAWCVIHGLWDQLAKDGVPSDEIERLKRLTQEERADLWAALSKGGGSARGHTPPWVYDPVWGFIGGAASLKPDGTYKVVYDPRVSCCDNDDDN